MADGTAQLTLLPPTARRRRGGPWTDAELTALREQYTRGGGQLAARALPQRTHNSIKSKANRLGLHAPAFVRRDRRSWPHDAQIDAALRAACVAGAPAPGTYARLAECYGRPSWYFGRRATALKLDPGPLRRGWIEAELQILADTAHLTARHACVVLRDHGYERTPLAVQLQRRMREVLPGDGGMHHQSGLARLLGCSHVPLLRAIRLGDLHATLVQSGAGTVNESRYSIRERDIRRWLLANPYAIDLRKLPRESQAWLISVLAGQYGHG